MKVKRKPLRIRRTSIQSLLGAKVHRRRFNRCKPLSDEALIVPLPEAEQQEPMPEAIHETDVSFPSQPLSILELTGKAPDKPSCVYPGPRVASRIHKTVHHEDPPDNPEVSARLTNLSLRHAGTRPEWFDFEPLALSGRTRQCRRLFWQIMSDHSVKQKRMIALLAEEGMGKTAFLAELYAMLEHAENNILTLAPSSSENQPFQALRNILEQRFYISGEASFECIERYVRGAVAAIVDPVSARDVCNGILALWRRDGDSSESHASSPAEETRVIPLDDGGENAPMVAGEPGKSEEAFLDDIDAAFSMTVIPAAAQQMKTVPPVPPPLATVVTSMNEILEAHQLMQSESANEALDEEEDKPFEEENGAEIAGLEELAVPGHVQELVLPEPEYAEKPASLEPTMILPQLHNRSLSQTSSEDDVSYGDEEIAAIEREISEPLLRLFEADLKHNPLVIVLDNVECFDEASMASLAHLFQSLSSDVRLTVLMTSSERDQIPPELQTCGIDYLDLQSLSDSDLARLTRHILEKLSADREKRIVPKELCTLIAQRAYGSPKRAIDLTLRHFSPDRMIHWNEAIENLRHEVLPRKVGIDLVRRFKECSATERVILQLASHLNAPFTVSTIECILSTWPDFDLPFDFACSEILRKLRNDGFLERAEESFGTNTPTYVFKHECERQMIFSTAGEGMRQHVYSSAAQWYSLNNPTGGYDELIGDLWRNYSFMHEACRYYERAAYRALNRSHLSTAWSLFRKLLKSLPEGNVSAKIQLSLEGAHVAFRIGQVDDAFRLCRRACHQATLISAYTQAARAYVQMASMLVEMGSIRHISRYTARASSLLNHEGDQLTRCFLYVVYARRSLFMSRFAEAHEWMVRARQCVGNNSLTARERLYLEWTEAEIDAESGSPLKAIERLNGVIHDAEVCGDNSIKAKAYRSLGHVYEATDNLAGALEAWNISLGIVQEMNDVIMHANLLADIADGALALEARRTARAATEQCLGLAQQTHQKALIARCLANTAFLQYVGEQYERAVRTVRKAHKSAITLKNVYLWSRTLSILAFCNADTNSPSFNPVRANQIYRRLMVIYDRHEMLLPKARLLSWYAQFLVQTNQRMAALNAWRMMRTIYQQLGIEKAVAKAQAHIDEMMQGAEGN
ncbi:MAG: hypothetical protein IJM59_12335 [Proteobacteria bacterium]|nr:hypothetical protein [Pseudomonadota bacterium]